MVGADPHSFPVELKHAGMRRLGVPMPGSIIDSCLIQRPYGPQQVSQVSRLPPATLAAVQAGMCGHAWP